ncbi:hypothetical protein DRW41_08210 [Neobacillus piezotolerans]|uniref:Uncharacterized protein n=2 Tax=Neobacillus piezotolerans TaxID=2259171 RepID=A0A3D8GTK0_9BACI|nr:hypothetical protein DRW41_08210 [Neobacillus piezotolerans]
MLKGELAELEFTGEMKQNVLRKVRPGRKGPVLSKKIIPSLISAALILLFFGGMYEFVLVPHFGGNNHGPAANPGNKGVIPDDKEANDNEKLPEDSENVDTEQPVPDVEPGVDDSKGDNSNPSDHLPPEAPAQPDVMAILVTFSDKLNSLFEQDRFIPNSDYKYRDFSTKEELYGELAGLATRGVYEQFDRLFKETSDGLYLLPQGRGLFFLPDEPYETTKISDTEYQLVQKIDSIMYGPNYTISVTVTYVDGSWLITGTETKE